MFRLSGLLLLVALLAGCDTGTPPDDAPEVVSIAGEWEGTLGGGGDWGGRITLDLRQPADRPFGRASWTNGTRTTPATVGGVATADGIVRLDLDFSSRGTLEFLLDADGEGFSGTWRRGGLVGGEVVLTRAGGA